MNHSIASFQNHFISSFLHTLRAAILVFGSIPFLFSTSAKTVPVISVVIHLFYPIVGRKKTDDRYCADDRKLLFGQISIEHWKQRNEMNATYDNMRQTTRRALKYFRQSVKICDALEQGVVRGIWEIVFGKINLFRFYRVRVGQGSLDPMSECRARFQIPCRGGIEGIETQRSYEKKSKHRNLFRHINERQTVISNCSK
jgi:hypothetical protein